MFVSLILTSCTTDQGMMPRSEVEANSPWGYTDMCNDPERASDTHCPPEEENQ